MDEQVQKSASLAVDMLTEKLFKEGVFEHRQPSEKTKEMFEKLEDKIDEKFDTLSSLMHDEVKVLTENIDKKAPKAWLNWQWTLLGLLVVVITGIMGAQYGEIKELNDNITSILIKQATTEAELKAFSEQQQRIETTLDRVNANLNSLEVVQ